MKQFNIFYYALIGIMTAVFVLSLILQSMWYDKDIYSIAGQEYVRETRHYHNVTRCDYFPIERPGDIQPSKISLKGMFNVYQKCLNLTLRRAILLLRTTLIVNILNRNGSSASLVCEDKWGFHENKLFHYKRKLNFCQLHQSVKIGGVFS